MAVRQTDLLQGTLDLLILKVLSPERPWPHTLQLGGHRGSSQSLRCGKTEATMPRYGWLWFYPRRERVLDGVRDTDGEIESVRRMTGIFDLKVSDKPREGSQERRHRDRDEVARAWVGRAAIWDTWRLRAGGVLGLNEGRLTSDIWTPPGCQLRNDGRDGDRIRMQSYMRPSGGARSRSGPSWASAHWGPIIGQRPSRSTLLSASFSAGPTGHAMIVTSRW